MAWVTKSADPPTRVKIPKIGKRGFRGQKTPISGRPRKRVPCVQMSLQGTTRKMRIFGLKAPFSGATGNGRFLTPKGSFPDFEDFDPCRGSADSQVKLRNFAAPISHIVAIVICDWGV